MLGLLAAQTLTQAQQIHQRMILASFVRLARWRWLGACMQYPSQLSLPAVARRLEEHPQQQLARWLQLSVSAVARQQNQHHLQPGTLKLSWSPGALELSWPASSKFGFSICDP